MAISSRNLLNEYVCSEIRNDLICKAFKKVDRELFVPKKWREYAYSDSAIPLGGNSSISQPSLVAKMIDLLELKGREHVLEIGTASGYSAAILSLCCKHVDTIEIDPELAESAKKRLKSLGYSNVTVHLGDGSAGFPSKAPFDGIIVTAAARQIPGALTDQLKVGGRIVIPIEIEDSDMQELILGVKKEGKLIAKPITIVKFVPLV